jgi:hypothetical protein
MSPMRHMESLTRLKSFLEERFTSFPPTASCKERDDVSELAFAPEPSATSPFCFGVAFPGRLGI